MVLSFPDLKEDFNKFNYDVFGMFFDSREIRK